MSRYVIWTEDKNLEVFVGFDEGFNAFYLTIANMSTDSDDPETFRFHNIAHHPGVGMSLAQVQAILRKFGIVAPPELLQQLADDGLRSCASAPMVRWEGGAEKQDTDPPETTPIVRVLEWKSVI
jgi:hypothetical protein